MESDSNSEISENFESTEEQSISEDDSETFLIEREYEPYQDERRAM